MTILTTVPFYTIPREEDDRRNQLHDRLFELALRWHPWDEIEEHRTGLTTLDRLKDGDCVSARHLQAAVDYLNAAIAYYESGPIEPYRGRNAEALDNLRDLFQEVVIPGVTV